MEFLLKNKMNLYFELMYDDFSRIIQGIKIKNAKDISEILKPLHAYKLGLTSAHSQNVTEFYKQGPFNKNAKYIIYSNNTQETLKAFNRLESL